MKIFIVFFALLILHISYVAYQGDMNRYVEAQTALKALAEECAAGAALYYDPEEYAEGRMVFHGEEGAAYILYILEKSKKNIRLAVEDFSYRVFYEDDRRGYGADGHIPSVTVTLSVKTKDIFRLPFLRMEEVSRSAKYELSKT